MSYTYDLLTDLPTFKRKHVPKARVHILAMSKTSCMSPKTLVGDSMLMDYG